LKINELQLQLDEHEEKKRKINNNLNTNFNNKNLRDSEENFLKNEKLKDELYFLKKQKIELEGLPLFNNYYFYYYY
jgi:hypothetical protein